MVLKVCGDTLHIHYLDEGLGDVIVLLHGWGAKAETYRCIIDMLTPYFRVVAPDMPGFGESDEPSFAYTTEHYAVFVRAFCAALDIKEAVVIGHSHGGRTALKLAAGQSIPDSSGTVPFQIPKMVLFDSAGLIRKKSFSQKCRILRFKAAKKVLTAWPITKLFPGIPAYIERMRRKNGSEDYNAASETMRKSLVTVLNESLSDILSDVRVPTLLIWGENDTATPMYQAEEMKRKIPDCGLVVIKNAGHFSFLSDLVLTRRVLYSFLLPPQLPPSPTSETETKM